MLISLVCIDICVLVDIDMLIMISLTHQPVMLIMIVFGECTNMEFDHFSVTG